MPQYEDSVIWIDENDKVQIKDEEQHNVANWMMDAHELSPTERKTICQMGLERGLDYMIHGLRLSMPNGLQANSQEKWDRNERDLDVADIADDIDNKVFDKTAEELEELGFVDPNDDGNWALPEERAEFEPVNTGAKHVRPGDPDYADVLFEKRNQMAAEAYGVAYTEDNFPNLDDVLRDEKNK